LRRRVVKIAFLLCVTGLAVGGCKNSAQLLQDNNEGGWFSKPMDSLVKPVWSSGSSNQNLYLNPRGPVDANDLVGPDGACGAPVIVAAGPGVAPPPPPADKPVGSVAGDLAPAPMAAGAPPPVNPEGALPGQQPGGSAMLGGVALGMTECDVVRRAGMPGNINIGAGDRGERKVVLTYLNGNWPGIYTFDAGRLKVVDRAPEPPAPAKPARKNPKAKAAKPKTATREYVQ
jgi:hypothetical protein